jgi:hypothetical protein
MKTPAAADCTTSHAQVSTAPNASGANTSIPKTRNKIPRSHHQSRFLRVKTIARKNELRLPVSKATKIQATDFHR